MSLIDNIKSENHENSQKWELNPYSNPLSHSTMIFGFHCENRFYPIGTIFFIGKTGFMLSASHVFDDGLKKSKLNNEIKKLIDNENFKHTTNGDLGFSAVRFNTEGNGEVKRVTLIALEKIVACIPGDISYAAPFITEAIMPIEHLTLRPAILNPEEKVYSCGYTNFNYDFDSGFSLEDIKSNKFNWRDNFSFSFMVYEGKTTNIYTNKFLESYLNAPCFSVDYRIPSGLSGGPTFTENGLVCGINSASLGDESLISLLYPTVFTNIESSIRVGPLTIKKSSPIIEHMIFGNISTDGSEEKIMYGIKNDKPCIYHEWAEYLNSRAYENRNDQEQDTPTNPSKN